MIHTPDFRNIHKFIRIVNSQNGNPSKSYTANRVLGSIKFMELVREIPGWYNQNSIIFPVVSKLRCHQKNVADEFNIPNPRIVPTKFGQVTLELKTKLNVLHGLRNEGRSMSVGTGSNWRVQLWFAQELVLPHNMGRTNAYGPVSKNGKMRARIKISLYMDAFCIQTQIWRVFCYLYGIGKDFAFPFTGFHDIYERCHTISPGEESLKR